MSKVFIVADMSANHNGDFNQAENLVKAAKTAGADAIKVQVYTPDTMTLKSDLAGFTVGEDTIWHGTTLYDLYRSSCMPWEWMHDLKSVATRIGIELFATPFDKTSVDFLEKLGVPRYKTASYELVDIPLIEYISRTGKPLIMSTGMATSEEIVEATQAAYESGAEDITLLKCTSTYPTNPEDMNLLGITELKRKFDGYPGLSVGLSDHTTGIVAPIVAVSLGALMIEKHLTLSRVDSVIDGAFSLEPNEFQNMVKAIREAELLLGNGTLGPVECEGSGLKLRRSLFVVQDVRKGEKFTEDNVQSLRPGLGLSPKFLPSVLRAMSSQDVKKGTPLQWNLLR